MKVFDPFQLDTVNHCLWRDGERMPLTPKAFDVLRYLVEHADRLVTQDELLDAVWEETYVNPEGIRKYVLEIRKVLGDQRTPPSFIETLPKRGYRFIANVTDQSPRAAFSRHERYRGKHGGQGRGFGRTRSQLAHCLGRPATDRLCHGRGRHRQDDADRHVPTARAQPAKHQNCARTMYRRLRRDRSLLSDAGSGGLTASARRGRFAGKDFGKTGAHLADSISSVGEAGPKGVAPAGDFGEHAGADGQGDL